MPRHNATPPTTRPDIDLTHILPGLGMRHLEHSSLVAPAHDEAPVEAEPHALDRARQVRQGPPADPVRRVVERYQRVGPAHGQIPRRRGQGEREAGRRVRVQCV